MMIRQARVRDLDAIEGVENDAFDLDRLSRRSLRYFLAAGTTEAVVAEDGHGVNGYAMVGFRAGSKFGRLFTLAVAGRAARRGTGRKLLLACEAATLRRGRPFLRLEVRADNTAAIALYEQAGYARVGLFADYYEDGAPALRLRRALGLPL